MLLVLFIQSCTKEEDNKTVLADIDGNIYKTVTIGTQIWMAENLKTTSYNDGKPIQNVVENTAWGSLSTGAYCDYGNTPANTTTYGRLYNWYAVDNNAATKVASNGGKNVCPTGWHIPTNDDWHQLVLFLDQTAVMTEISTTLFSESLIAGGKLKEAGTTHWVSSNTGATNEMGFTALPGGYRYMNGTFALIGGYGCWWSSMEYSAGNAWNRFIDYNTSTVYKSSDNKQDGLSVRCLKDNLPGK